MTRILTREDVERVIMYTGLDRIMDELITRLERAIKTYDTSDIQIPIRSGFNYSQPQTGLIEWMPLYKQGKEVIIKVVGYHPSNPEREGLPTIISTVYAYDTSTGSLIGVMDGVLLTALRTGAASAVATKYMAAKDSRTLGLIGCGAQAVTQLHALSRIFKLNKVLAYDIDPDITASFARRSDALKLSIEIVPSGISEIMQESDIVCTATSIDVGAGPLFDGVDVKDHVHINAVGSDFPGKTELPKSLLLDSHVCPDFMGQAMIEGECQQLDESQVGPRLTDVVKSPGKYSELMSGKTVFDSTGWALEDMVAMELFMELAQDLNLGQEIEVENLAGDARNPYSFMHATALVR